MGKSVLLYDDSNQQKQFNNNTNNRSNVNSGNGSGADNTVLNMDLIQKQQLQKNLILNQEVILLEFIW